MDKNSNYKLNLKEYYNNRCDMTVKINLIFMYLYPCVHKNNNKITTDWF